MCRGEGDVWTPGLDVLEGLFGTEEEGGHEVTGDDVGRSGATSLTVYVDTGAGVVAAAAAYEVQTSIHLPSPRDRK